MQRLGVLTGGGDCPGLNAVIRAVVKTAIGVYDWEVYGIEDGFEGLLLPNKVRRLQTRDVRGILPLGGTILGTTNRANPFAYEVESGGKIEKQDRSAEVVGRFHELGLDGLIVVGGDGSLHIAHKLNALGIPVVGVPKTIDNDLPNTLVTFGFDTAVNTAMEALDKLHTTAESHDRIFVLELMGRDAGWIALKAGIAGGADVILIPEIPYTIEAVLEKIRARSRGKAKFSLVVAAEGAVPAGGEAVYLEDRPVGAAKRLGGIAEQIARQLQANLDMEVRSLVLGHLQRGGSPTAFDRLLGSRFGTQAVHLAAQGKFDHMVALDNDAIIAVPLATTAGKQKKIPLDSDLLATAIGLNISLGNSPEFIANLRTGEPA